MGLKTARRTVVQPSPHITSAAAAKPARRKRAERLDPAVRREMILDAAGDLVMKRGVSHCTLDAVAAASSVSKPLVYKYFQSREALLGALLQREFDHVRGRNLNLMPPGAPIEEAHRVHIRRYLGYLADRGGLMRALINDPGITEQTRKAARTERAEVLQYWVTRTMESYGLPKNVARMGMIMTIMALEGAEDSVRLGKVDLDEAADFWTTFILAGWQAAAREFGSLGDGSPQPDH
jgi:AcrR family transcriptional regulator